MDSLPSSNSEEIPESLVQMPNIWHLLEISHFHRSPSTGQLVTHVCWPTCSCAVKGLDFCFHLHFSLVLPLYLVYTALLFCYMCKLFQTACVRKQNINKQDPMILHLEIIFTVFLRKGAIQHNITGRLEVSELYLKLHLWAMKWNSDFFFFLWKQGYRNTSLDVSNWQFCTTYLTHEITYINIICPENT